ncbi:MAG: carboxypeptidase M32, partial [Chitinophagales bacterium]
AKKKKLPTDFVVKLSDATSEAFHAWIEARKQDDFSVYIKPLEKMVEIQREKTEIYGYEEHPYNALMGDYEPGAKVSEIDTLFADVRAKLTPFIEKVFAAKKSDDSFMYKHFPKDKQWDFGMDMLSLLGYDIDAGRQDIAEHPFSTSFSPLDSRVTTRVDENNFYDMTWSCAHEAGHALYEQGMPVAQYGLPCGDAVSLGIHESQSRLYENNVARSMAFWQHNYGKLQTAFPANLQAVSLEDFYKGVNIVKPSLVRTDADELTYHFHIMIRYEIEKKLILGEIEVKDLPTIWNEAYKKYLKIDVPSDKVGVLQDVHWAHGGFGYFPTYSLGSFYAAQFFAKASEKIDNLEAKIAKGDMQPLLIWLRENIYQHGRFYTPQELCTKATGESLNFDYFMAYAEKKYGAIYGL